MRSSPPRRCVLKAGIVDALAKWFEFSPYQSPDGDAPGLTLQLKFSAMALEVLSRLPCRRWRIIAVSG
ncbi:hypothetical protein DMH27_08010 [Raoultella planticola]|nr:hypothetical protein [Raoultella planticola]